MYEALKLASNKIRDVAGFKEWLARDLGEYLPFGAAACGYGRLHAGGVATDYIVNVNFPVSHFQEICNPSGGIETPLLRRWLKTEKPLFFDPAVHHDWPELSSHWMSVFTKNELQNAVVHGLFDWQRYVGTYFSFHRLPSETNQDLCEVLATVTPLLHDTFCRVIASVEASQELIKPQWSLLTERELTVLTWVGRGRSNGEIAELMDISKNTVKHHVSHIMQKLGGINRVQLVNAYMAYPPGIVTKGTTVL